MASLKDIRESTLDSLRAEYYVLTERLAGIDAEIELLQERRKVVETQRQKVNGAAISLIAAMDTARNVLNGEGGE